MEYNESCHSPQARSVLGTGQRKEYVMNEALSILSLFILAVLTQHMVSWAGSILHEVSNQESQYAVFTFRDDRNMPMTTNILMNICIPNVCIIFIFMFAERFNLPYIKEHLLIYITAFFLYRAFLICVLLRRKEMYSAGYEIAIAAAAILLARFLIDFFLSTEETVFITASELREELWFAILVILYQFVKQILDKRVVQNTVLTKGQITKYVRNKFQKFYKKYNHLLDIGVQNRYVCIFLYSVMIFEDYNRGPIIRLLERIKTRLGRKATVGIMQMKSDTPLTDEESIVRFLAWAETRAKDRAEGYAPYGLDEKLVCDLAWEHNNDEAYGKAVAYIYNRLCEYIDEIPEYRNAFKIRDEYREIQPYASAKCGDIEDFCAHIDGNAFIDLAKGQYSLQDVKTATAKVELVDVAGGRELVISDMESLYVRGNGSELTGVSQNMAALSFQNCKQITLEHLVLRTSADSAEDSGAVLRFENCQNVTLKHLEVECCGTYGIVFSHGDVDIQDCKIHNCAYGGILIQEVHCTMEDTEIYDCQGASDSILHAECCKLIMSNVDIHDCTSKNMIIFSDNETAVCREVSIRDCSAAGRIHNLREGDGITVG